MQGLFPAIQQAQQLPGQYGFVKSRDEAEKFYIPLGQSVILFNQTDDVFYKKSVDLSGRSIVTECRYQEVQPEPPPKYVTASEIGDLVQSKIDNALAPIVAALEARQKDVRGKGGKNELGE